MIGSLARITLRSRTCKADDYNTEDGSGFPDDVDFDDEEVVTIIVDDVMDTGLNDVIQDKLDDFGCGQWDGGNTGYDPDGVQLQSTGEMVERFCLVEIDPSL